MPKCKNCGARLSKFDKDICPVCGVQRPLDGVSSETIEITSNLDLSSPEFKDFKPHTKLGLFLWFALLGWTGAPYFYLKYPKCGVVWIILTILIEGGLGCALLFGAKMSPLWSFLIPAISIYIINIIFGILFFFKKNLKDGNGEFLR